MKFNGTIIRFCRKIPNLTDLNVVELLRQKQSTLPFDNKGETQSFNQYIIIIQQKEELKN